MSNTQLPAEMQKALNEFLSAAINLTKKWDQYDHTGDYFIEKYPFNKSFNDLVIDIKEWVEFQTK